MTTLAHVVRGVLVARRHASLLRTLGFETLETPAASGRHADRRSRRRLDGDGAVSAADRRRRRRDVDQHARLTAGARVRPFTYTHPTDVAIDRVRVAFVNDGAGAGRRAIATCSSTASRWAASSTSPKRRPCSPPACGTPATNGRLPGFRQTEALHVQRLPAIRRGGLDDPDSRRRRDRPGADAAAASAGMTVATFNNVGGNYATGQFVTFTYNHSVGRGRSARFASRSPTTASPRRRGQEPARRRRDARRRRPPGRGGQRVFDRTSGSPASGVIPGLWQSEYLHANGYLQFASTAVPGALALGSSLISVNEGAGTVSIPVVRTGGSDGTVGRAVHDGQRHGDGRQRLHGAIGELFVFGPGETSKSIVVPIANDSLGEANETFNVAIDQALGGATLALPRTATITIVDNDGPPPSGNGNGLLGRVLQQRRT